MLRARATSHTKFIVIATIVLLIALNTHAQARTTQKGPAPTSTSSSMGSDSSFGIPATLYLDVSAYWGTTKGELNSQADDVSLNQQGVSLTVGALYQGIFLGIGTDYRQVNNSKVPTQEIGSFKGTRWAPLTLATGYLGNNILLKLEYQPTGTLDLKQPTYQGATVTYGNSSGYRASLMYNVWSKLMVGPQYESLKYSSRFDSLNGETTESLTMTHIGLAGAYVF